MGHTTTKFHTHYLQSIYFRHNTHTYQHTGPNTLGKTEGGEQDMIYMVRAIREQKGRTFWSFQGKVQGSREIEDVTLAWMNQNYMGPEWRAKTVFQRPGYWYKVEVNKTSDPDQRQGCTIGCVIKALTYSGLSEKVARFESGSKHIVASPFTEVLQLSCNMRWESYLL